MNWTMKDITSDVKNVIKRELAKDISVAAGNNKQDLFTVDEVVINILDAANKDEYNIYKYCKNPEKTEGDKMIQWMGVCKAEGVLFLLIANSYFIMPSYLLGDNTMDYDRRLAKKRASAINAFTNSKWPIDSLLQNDKQMESLYQYNVKDDINISYVIYKDEDKTVIEPNPFVEFVHKSFETFNTISNF